MPLIDLPEGHKAWALPEGFDREATAEEKALFGTFFPEGFVPLEFYACRCPGCKKPLWVKPNRPMLILELNRGRVDHTCGLSFRVVIVPGEAYMLPVSVEEN